MYFFFFLSVLANLKHAKGLEIGLRSWSASEAPIDCTKEILL